MIRDLLKNLDFTIQEKAVVDYILQCEDCLFIYNAKELAKLTYVSPPTIIRLVKKLGFERYLDFQLAYAKEYALSQEEKTTSLNRDSSVNDVMNALPQIYHHIFLETKNMVNKEAFVRIINYALQAKQIDFYANDHNYSQIQSICLKLNSLGIRAQAFNAVNEHYIDTLNAPDVLSFVVSHTGKNQAMIETAYYLRQKHIRVIAITGHVHSALQIICNESLFIDLNLHSLPRELLLYGISINYILDILVTTIALRLQKNP